MLKKTMLAVGAIAAVAMSMPVAEAAPRHLMRVHRYSFVAAAPRHVHAARAIPHRIARRRSRTASIGWPVATYAPRRLSARHRVASRARMAAPYRPVTMGAVSAPAASGVQTGRASFYHGGGLTAAGGRVGVATCAHRWLPFGTRVLVTNLANARSAVLTVNDRGPFVGGRIVDVSSGAAGLLGMLHTGTAKVSLQVVGNRG